MERDVFKIPCNSFSITAFSSSHLINTNQTFMKSTLSQWRYRASSHEGRSWPRGDVVSQKDWNNRFGHSALRWQGDSEEWIRHSTTNTVWSDAIKLLFSLVFVNKLTNWRTEKIRQNWINRTWVVQVIITVPWNSKPFLFYPEIEYSNSDALLRKQKNTLYIHHSPSYGHIYSLFHQIGPNATVVDFIVMSDVAKSLLPHLNQ